MTRILKVELTRTDLGATSEETRTACVNWTFNDNKTGLDRHAPGKGGKQPAAVQGKWGAQIGGSEIYDLTDRGGVGGGISKK